MRVEDVMSTRIVAVTPATTLKEAVHLLAEHSITAMPVVDGYGRLLGVISEADLIQDAVMPDPRAHVVPVRLRSRARAARVADVMTHQVVTVAPRTDLADAADLLVATALKSVPVVDGERVVGMLSRRDIILALSRRDEHIRRECLSLLARSGQPGQVDVSDGVVTVKGLGASVDPDVVERLVATVPGVVAIELAGRVPAVG